MILLEQGISLAFAAKAGLLEEGEMVCLKRQDVQDDGMLVLEDDGRSAQIPPLSANGAISYPLHIIIQPHSFLF